MQLYAHHFDVLYTKYENISNLMMYVYACVYNLTNVSMK